MAVALRMGATVRLPDEAVLPVYPARAGGSGHHRRRERRPDLLAHHAAAHSPGSAGNRGPVVPGQLEQLSGADPLYQHAADVPAGAGDALLRPVAIARRSATMALHDGDGDDDDRAGTAAVFPGAEAVHRRAEHRRGEGIMS